MSFALLSLMVHAAERPHAELCTLELRAPGGGPLPTFEPGAHIRVRVTLPGGATDLRHYSLVDVGTDAPSGGGPTRYRLGVRLESAGRGGSHFMHALQPGDMLQAEPPRNDFPLGEHTGTAVLVAGGIGVTPLTAMAAHCRRKGRSVRMVYASRSRAQMAFAGELRTLLGDALVLHADDEATRPLDVAALLDGCAPDDVLYVCGPRPLLDALLEGATARGWAPGRIRFELFSAPQAVQGDHAFDLVLQQSGETLRVGERQSILECLEAHGCDPLSDCRRGECGVCAVDVIEGEIDHRDHVLTTSERAAGKVIQVCVSRARGARLVLDL